MLFSTMVEMRIRAAASGSDAIATGSRIFQSVNSGSMRLSASNDSTSLAPMTAEVSWPRGNW
jgi:hypothetical protein